MTFTQARLIPQILRRVDVPSDLKGTAFVILRGLCSAFGRLPRSCLTGDGLGTQEGIPFATHGYADLWKLEWGGRRVAVKTLRFTSGDDRSKMTKVSIFLVSRSIGTLSGTHYPVDVL